MLYSTIKQKYNKNTSNIIKSYSKHNKTIANLKAATTFLMKCKQAGIIPNFITNATKNVPKIFTQQNKIPPNIETTLMKHIYRFHCKILKLLIQQKHTQIFVNKDQMERINMKLNLVLDEGETQLLIRSEKVLYNKYMYKNKIGHIKKLQTLRERKNCEMNIRHNTDWFVNTTHTDIPTHTQWFPPS